MNEVKIWDDGDLEEDPSPRKFPSEKRDRSDRTSRRAEGLERNCETLSEQAVTYRHFDLTPAPNDDAEFVLENLDSTIDEETKAQLRRDLLRQGVDGTGCDANSAATVEEDDLAPINEYTVDSADDKSSNAEIPSTAGPDPPMKKSKKSGDSEENTLEPVTRRSALLDEDTGSGRPRKRMSPPTLEHIKRVVRATRGRKDGGYPALGERRRTPSPARHRRRTSSPARRRRRMSSPVKRAKHPS